MKPRLGKFVRARLPILTPRLRLELPSLTRAREYAPLIGDYEVSRWLLRVPFPYRLSDARAFIRRSHANFRSGEELSLAVIERASDRLVGGIGLHHLSWEHRHAEVGYWFGRPYWGRGYGSESIAGLLEECFGHLGFHRIEAGIFEGNHRSDHLLRKAGFRSEGVRREAFVRDGRWFDDRFFGLLKEDWERRRSRRRPTGR